LTVVTSSMFFNERRRLVGLAAKNRLAAVYGGTEFVEAGGLIGYGLNTSALFRHAATYVDKILKGAKPADLPVEQPTTFELVINLKTAKTFSGSCQATFSDAGATAAASSSPGGTARHTGAGVPT